MNDKFSFYQTEGLWGIIENASDEKQTSIKSYFGSDLIIKRLNEQAEQIDQLKQQLAEKDIRIEELECQFAYECECNKQLVDLQKQLAEKDKEIEKLKITKNNAIECADLFKVALSVRQKDLAIQELEKVKVNLKDRISMMKNEEHSYLQKVVAWYDICDQINNQIKELKGENDVKD